MKIFKLVLIMFLMNPTLSVAQSTTNSIYMDQVGDGSTITITQEGQNNQIGDVSQPAPFTLQGNGQNVDVNIIGNNNTVNGNITQSDGSSTTLDTTGDDNSIVFDVGSSADTGSSTTDMTIQGSINTVTMTQGAVSSATNANQTIAITGDLNTYTSNIETDDVTNTVAVTGDQNTLTLLQNGQSGKNIDLTLQGDTNSITINQKSTLNVDSVVVNSQSSGSTVLINQCNPGGC